MHVISANLNGIRAALKKGFADWLHTQNPDVVLLQELKADPDVMAQVVKAHPELVRGYHYYWHPAEKKGYSGVGILSKLEPTAVHIGCDNPIYDAEGRVLRIEHPSGWQFCSLYLPSGSQGDERQVVKEAFMAYFKEWIAQQPGWDQQLIIGGDFNICHQAIDIHDPVRLKNSSGFLPHEREWFSELLAQGFTDSFRHLHPHLPDQYTWWSYRGQAKARNKGWRLDYHLVPTAHRGLIEAHAIHTELAFSDHVPISLHIADRAV